MWKHHSGVQSVTEKFDGLFGHSVQGFDILPHCGGGHSPISLYVQGRT